MRRNALASSKLDPKKIADALRHPHQMPSPAVLRPSLLWTLPPPIDCQNLGSLLPPLIDTGVLLDWIFQSKTYCHALG
jgi:hypothetical protein